MAMYSCREGDYVSETAGMCPTHNTPLEELCECGSGKFGKDCCAMGAAPAVPAEGPAPEVTPTPPVEEVAPTPPAEEEKTEETPTEETPPVTPAPGM